MNSEHGYVAAGKEKLHYLKWGSGKRLLLAFHGYGEEAAVFSDFPKYLGAEYTILSFDLPHHSESKWGSEHLRKQDIVTLVDALCATWKVDKVSLLGYSMGAAVCLVIIEHLPARIDKAALIAADGLRADPYFYFFTQTFIGKKLFRHMLGKPTLVLSIAGLLKSMKLVHASRHKFVTHFLQSEERRQFLLKVWPAMRDVIPHTATVKRAIRAHSIQVSLFMGVHDTIMPPALARKFKAGLDTVHLYILEKGHRVLDKDNVQQIAERLL